MLPACLVVALSCRVWTGKCFESVPLWGCMDRKLLRLVSISWGHLRQQGWGRMRLFRGQPSEETKAIIYVGGEKGWSQVMSSRDREKGVRLRCIKGTKLTALGCWLELRVQGCALLSGLSDRLAAGSINGDRAPVRRRWQRKTMSSIWGMIRWCCLSRNLCLATQVLSWFLSGASWSRLSFYLPLLLACNSSPVSSVQCLRESTWHTRRELEKWHRRWEGRLRELWVCAQILAGKVSEPAGDKTWRMSELWWASWKRWRKKRRQTHAWGVWEMVGVHWPELFLLEEGGLPWGVGGLISPSSSWVGLCPQWPLTTQFGPQDKGRGVKSERWKQEEKGKAVSVRDPRGCGPGAFWSVAQILCTHPARKLALRATSLLRFFLSVESKTVGGKIEESPCQCLSGKWAKISEFVAGVIFVVDIICVLIKFLPIWFHNDPFNFQSNPYKLRDFGYVSDVEGH